METLIEIPELDKIKRKEWLNTKYTPLQQTEIDTLTKNQIWITANRRQLYVKGMTTQHIKNCIDCWEGRGKSKIPNGYLGGREKWLDIFYKELSGRN